ncbi:YlqD family protein [Neobacillus sp. PS3-40]|uniref:YlqD family protein n=1 Tax=Neobacillus sp. PS3-40 TaxID=3070679 RepID=UPI0027E1DEC0|nr:YlqD family protein [Neobacillus sp. PS3-40]WML43680.1 YlqD family protein [Neobacillus sp. PS3-40]
MKILQTVVVKQILTEDSKQKLLDQYFARKMQYLKECDQLQFELKRLEKTNKFETNGLKRHFEKEMQMRKEKVKLHEFQIEQLHMLPLGSELKEKEVQALVDINVGDQWDEHLGSTTIIIKDGIIAEIR